MIRIALTGAHGTGKTTLIDRLSHDLSEFGKVHTCREAPRLVIGHVNDQEFFRRGNNSPHRQGLIFVEHLLEELRKSSNCDILLTDRTLVDHLTYTTVLFPEFVESIEYDVYKKMSITSLANYDSVFKIPIEFPVKDDGVREGSVDFQSQIDRTLDGIYREGDFAPLIIRGSIDQRARTVVDKIRSII